MINDRYGYQIIIFENGNEVMNHFSVYLKVTRFQLKVPEGSTHRDSPLYNGFFELLEFGDQFSGPNGVYWNFNRLRQFCQSYLINKADKAEKYFPDQSSGRNSKTYRTGSVRISAQGLS